MKSDDDTKNLRTIADTAKLFSVSNRQIYRFSKQGKLELVKIGPYSTRVTQASIDRFFEQIRQDGPQLQPAPKKRLSTLKSILAIIAVLAALQMTAAPSAMAIECQASRGQDGRYWAWREKDGRRCWYPGRRGKSKAALHWRTGKARSAGKRPSYGGGSVQHVRPRASSPAGDASERDAEAVMLETVWPALPNADTFADRWNAMASKR